jgi:hypothetical protein
MALVDDWNAWRACDFPAGLAGLEIDGVDVTSIDTFAAGCLDTYFDLGRLDERRTSVLEDCAQDLERILPRLTGEASVYFSQLAGLCLGVLIANKGRR